MRTRITLLVAAVMAMTVLPGVAYAEGDNDPIYLSLGTSLAAGTVADDVGRSIPFSNVSYTDQLHARLVEFQAFEPSMKHVKLGCPGETVFTFEAGGICNSTGPLPIYGGSQLDEAIAVLETGRVDLVTIDLGANDLIAVLPSALACGDDFGCVYGIIDGVAAGVQGVVATLQAAAPGVQIVAMNYYNPYVTTWSGYFAGVPVGYAGPDPAFAVQSDQLMALYNALLTARMAGLRVPTADVYRAYDAGNFSDTDGDGVPTNVEIACDWTSMCPEAGDLPNIHATKKGYKVIAKTILGLVKTLS